MTTATDRANIQGTYTGIGGRFVTRAIAAKRSNALIYHKYMTVGVHTVTFKVKGTLLEPTVSYPWVSATTTVTVENAIDKAVIVSPTIAKTDEDVSFYLEPHIGIYHEASGNILWSGILLNIHNCMCINYR